MELQQMNQMMIVIKLINQKIVVQDDIEMDQNQIKMVKIKQGKMMIIVMEVVMMKQQKQRKRIKIMPMKMRNQMKIIHRIIVIMILMRK